ncbi:hypothetical protein NL108_009610 [Boleophthalmus pectinirostris]|nr:hypothetical protein NL108_009610 [Boleophthalmus pectinirostris]
MRCPSTTSVNYKAAEHANTHGADSDRTATNTHKHTHHSTPTRNGTEERTEKCERDVPLLDTTEQLSHCEHTDNPRQPPPYTPQLNKAQSHRERTNKQNHSPITLLGFL